MKASTVHLKQINLHIYSLEYILGVIIKRNMRENISVYVIMPMWAAPGIVVNVICHLKMLADLFFYSNSNQFVNCFISW